MTIAAFIVNGNNIIRMGVRKDYKEEQIFHIRLERVKPGERAKTLEGKSEKSREFSTRRKTGRFEGKMVSLVGHSEQPGKGLKRRM